MRRIFLKGGGNMLICGLQKLSLLDYPDKMAATVFTGGCNFRCPFCHNAPLVTDVQRCPVISEEEVLELLKKRAGILDGVCITGGEPLLQRDIREFIARVKDIGYLVKLDTNGSMPDRLGELIKSGLIDYIAMDIKNCREKYAVTAGWDGLDIGKIEESVRLIMNSGIDYEFRTTLVRQLHTEEDMVKISQWIGGAEKYFLQTFEDSGNLIKTGFSGFNIEETTAFKNLLKPHFVHVGIRGL